MREPNGPLSPADIEAIVRAVIDRITGTSTAELDVAAADGAGRSMAAPRHIVVDSRIVTAQLLEREYATAKRLTIRSDAVVTPSARDWLNERDVCVLTGDRDVTKGSEIPDVVLGVQGTFDTGPMLRCEPLASCRTESLARSGLITTVREMGDHIARGGRVGIFITEQPDAAVCLANRRSGVRAVQASTPDAATRSIREVAANMLVLCPTGATQRMLPQLVLPLIAARHDPCPELLRGALS